MPSATTSGADKGGGSAPRHREHNQGNQDRKCTPDQVAAVLRIRRCSATAFYDILGLEAVRATCTEAEIKKAYRKQSLLTHPDKNGHEHADEAFKMVARAFSVLCDKEKREKYDRFGTDPDSRFASAQQQNPFAGFANRASGGGGGTGGGQGMWEEEISPEEMFARFFGGGFGGGGPFGGGGLGAFDTGPQFVFNLNGGPGIRVHQFGGARPRARPRNPGQQQAEDTRIISTILGLLPILLLFVLPIISSLFAGDATSAVPRISFERPEPPLTSERTIKDLGVKYYVNPRDIASLSNHKLYQLDKSAHVLFIQTLQTHCERERRAKMELRSQAQGWFFQDPVKMEAADQMETPACDRLHKIRL